MAKNILYLLLSILPLFVLVNLLHRFLVVYLAIKNTILSDNLFNFITNISVFVIASLIAVFFIKPKITGIVFLVWSMLKIMFIMGYFVLNILPEKKHIENSIIVELVIIYVVYLIYEVIFGIRLIKQEVIDKELVK
jgi:hypothetical protein